MLKSKEGIEVKANGDFTTIEVVGDLTASSQESMNHAFQKACSYDARNMIIKFDGKSRINSAGIALIISLVIESQDSDYKIFLTGVSRHFRKIFELVGLTKYTTIVESEQEIGIM